MNKNFVQKFDDFEVGGLYKFTTSWHCFFDPKNSTCLDDSTTENKTFLVLEKTFFDEELKKDSEYPIKILCLDDNQEYIILFDSQESPKEPIEVILTPKIKRA